MPNFSVPNNINAGDPLDATKAMANWNQVVTDLNGAKIDATNTAASFAKDVVEPAFSTWKPFSQLAVQVGGGVSTTQYFAIAGGTSGDWRVTTVLPFLAGLVAGSRATNWRLRWSGITNAVAPAITFTGGMFGANTSFGASGSGATIAKTGVVLTGSSFTWATPTANTLSANNTTSAFTISVQQPYVIAMDVSAGTAANSVTQFIVVLEYQQA